MKSTGYMRRLKTRAQIPRDARCRIGGRLESRPITLGRKAPCSPHDGAWRMDPLAGTIFCRHSADRPALYAAGQHRVGYFVPSGDELATGLFHPGDCDRAKVSGPLRLAPPLAPTRGLGSATAGASPYPVELDIAGNAACLSAGFPAATYFAAAAVIERIFGSCGPVDPVLQENPNESARVGLLIREGKKGARGIKEHSKSRTPVRQNA